MYFYKLGPYLGQFYYYLFYTGFCLQPFKSYRIQVHILGLPIIQTGQNIKDVCLNKNTKLKLFGIKIF